MFDIKEKIIFKNLLLVADKILKIKDYPLYINENCQRVTVSPYTETYLKKFQVKSSLFFHFGNLLPGPTPQKIKSCDSVSVRILLINLACHPEN